MVYIWKNQKSWERRNNPSIASPLLMAALGDETFS
jgi:hypothetical protein